MFPRNINRITSNLIKKSPYNFDVIWSKSNYLLIEMNPKHPPKGKIPDYDMEAHTLINGTIFEITEISDRIWREERVAELNKKGYF